MKISDEKMKRSIALPAAAAAATTAEVDLGADRVGAVGANLEVHLSVPALANLADAKNLTIEFEDSASSGGSFAPVETTGNMVVTGAGGIGAAAKDFRFYLPPDTRRFVRAKATVDAVGGDNTASALVMEFKV